MTAQGQPDGHFRTLSADIESGTGRLPPSTTNLAIDIVSFFQVNGGTYSPASAPIQEFDITNARYVSVYNRSRFPFLLCAQPLAGTASLNYLIEPYERHDICTDFSLAKLRLGLQMGAAASANPLGPVSVSDADSGDSYNGQNAPAGRLYILAADRPVEHRTYRYAVNPRINYPLSGTDAGAGVTLDPSTAGTNWGAIMSTLINNPGPANVTVTWTMATGTTRTASLPSGQYSLPVECKKVSISGQTGAFVLALASELLTVY